MLQYRTTLLLYKKKAYREQSISRATAVRELLEYVCQEDRSHPAPDTNIMGQYERYRRPFTAALASPRGYERENVWNTIVEVRLSLIPSVCGLLFLIVTVDYERYFR